MRAARKGREFYSKYYEDAIKLHAGGLSVSDIAKKLDISYSAVYHWVKGIRKPEAGNVNSFTEYLEKHGPVPVVDLKEKFPKHNELFLISARRGLPVKRYMMKKRFGEYATWYYLEHQEEELKKRVGALLEKVREVKEKIRSAIK